MSRIGLFCFLGRGHLNPGAALGRALRARGHDVTVFHVAIAEAAVRAAGLKFRAVDDRSSRQTSEQVRGQGRLQSVVTMRDHALTVLEGAPAAIRSAGVDALVIDQLDVGAASVAERLAMPFVSVSCGPPLHFDDAVPCPYFHSRFSEGRPARMRNRLGNALMRHLASPVLRVVNRQRRAWRLPPIDNLNDLFSKRAIVTQLPAALDMPRPVPVPHLFHTGPFRDGHQDRKIPFPWEALNGKPLLFASLGTIRYDCPEAFRAIAQACAALDVQLVLSLGGGRLLPEHLGPLAGNPIVVHFAPQGDLLERAALAINCAGMNTTLDAVLHGIPVVAIPIAEDQPGVAARIDLAGLGVVVPFRALTPGRLRRAIEEALDNPSYGQAARRHRAELVKKDSLVEAAQTVERTLGLDRPSAVMTGAPETRSDAPRE